MEVVLLIGLLPGKRLVVCPVSALNAIKLVTGLEIVRFEQCSSSLWKRPQSKGLAASDVSWNQNCTNTCSFLHDGF